jgi:hypothetical protein
MQRQSQISKSSASHGGETKDAAVLVYDVVPTGKWFANFRKKVSFHNAERIVQRRGVISEMKGLFSSLVFKDSCVIFLLGPCNINIIFLDLNRLPNTTKQLITHKFALNRQRFLKLNFIYIPQTIIVLTFYYYRCSLGVYSKGWKKLDLYLNI